MAQDSKKFAGSVSRRQFLVASSAAGVAGLAGCSGQSNSETDAPATEETETEAPETTTSTPEETSESSAPQMLTAEGSSTVYPIANKGSSYWNSNAPPSDGEYWGTSDESTVPGWDELGAPDMRLADYFASLYGFEPTETQANPAFATSIGLSHSGTGCKSVRDGLVDIGNSSGPITAELGISEDERDANYVDHVLGRDGQPVVVSKDVHDAGVTELTGEEVRQIYQNEITNWSEVGGHDQEIYVVGRAEGSGTDTSFRLNMLGSADASMEGVDTRKGQNQQVATVVQQNDGAIAYMALAFTGPEVIPVGINFEGTLYAPDKSAEHTIFDSDYPLNRDLHQYTTITEDTPSGTDMREAAFMNMFLTTFGQKLFVEDNNYIPLPDKDLQSEKDKLPSQA
ncbi:substrate-binding domain-containing protein [Haloferax chudinovii]|uniref:Substrate-binding domain-containing protein n=1 Tax=Haloferax chudinovii TaxID=1109010 RepID=A0ABD5X9B1_9EURY